MRRALLRRDVAAVRRAYTVLSPAHFRQAPAPFADALLQDASSSVVDTAATNSSHDSSATYERLLQRLYQVNRFTAVKLGIENMKQLNEAFGDPTSQYPIVHVAGTNGKGSVSLKVAKALERSGYRTGLFVSPHVSCFRERIQINGELISEAQVCEHLAQIFNVSAQFRIPATFFEITTMLAFQHFAKQRVDCVVLETGLGGRLDATNIVHPAVSVITSIGMDHTRILGGTIDAIAREKAGIIKRHTPVVIGPNVPLDVMQQFADAADAPLIRVDSLDDFDDDFNAENTAIARATCEQLNALTMQQPLTVKLSNPRVQSALESRPPCRFQVLHVVRPNSNEKKVTIVLDVAHNMPAFEKLMHTLRQRFPTQRYRFVCGFSADKDIAKVMDPYRRGHRRETSERPVCTDSSREGEPSSWCVAGGESTSSLQSAGRAPIQSIASIEDGVERGHCGCAMLCQTTRLSSVCGSVFLMAEARQALASRKPVGQPVDQRRSRAPTCRPPSQFSLAAAEHAATSSVSTAPDDLLLFCLRLSRIVVSVGILVNRL
ncbi:hypothetical protein PINS_up021826 [Pythium insidiosum]|nr:hypothetical protein PINS_up021826 [Pythium insidiosum]